jgi:hypothetical protein
MKQARRRSAKEWERLVREWERSGQPAERFAARRRLSRKSLEWWRWRLRRSEAASRSDGTPSVELVPVQVAPEPSGGGAPGGHGLAWELEAPRGYVLRVYGHDGQRALRQALTVVARGRRRR